jgi:hypothetical protein
MGSVADHKSLDEDAGGPYFEALGRFVHEFARAEAAVHIGIHRFAGVSSETAAKFKGGMRLSDLVTVTRHLAKANRDRLSTGRVKELLDQLDKISSLRNQVVHSGVQTASEKVESDPNYRGARALRAADRRAAPSSKSA